MQNEVTIISDMAAIGDIADHIASRSTFQDYQETKTANTIRRQKTDLAVFSRYLEDAKIMRTAQQLYELPEAWRGMSYGLVKGFIKWQLQEGYAIGSINVRLATVKTYCVLAAQAKALDASRLDLIKTVKGYTHQSGRNLDINREVKRIGNKKEVTTLLNEEQARRIKTPLTNHAQAKKDALLMCLLLEHGFRCSEISSLTAEMINLHTGYINLYREKNDLAQTHRLSADTLRAAMDYLTSCPTGRVFGSVRGINKRVRYLGKKVLKLDNLSPHDCRHYWATIAMRNGTDVKALQTAGGWKSPYMPLRYAEAAKVANEGVKLTREE